MKLSDILKRFKWKREDEDKALFVRIVPLGSKEEGKRRGRSVAVYVGNYNQELFAKVYHDEICNRWRAEARPGLPEIEYFPDEASRSPWGVRLDIPRTRLEAVALAAAHLGRLLR